MKKITTIVLLIGLSIGAAYAATAAKGVFSVSSTRKVQFANAVIATRAATRNLYQWSELDGLKDEGWDVLTSAEWTYLLITRDGEGMSKNALGTVGEQKGLVILPDEWENPIDTLDFHPVTEGIAYDKNKYSEEEWALMVESGAVFLPCGGNGHDDNGNFVFDSDGWEEHGAYWAKDEYASNTSNANCMRFNLSDIHDLNNQIKTSYYSVILVKTVSLGELYEEHDATAFATDMANSRGSDSVLVHRTLVKDSTLYTLCLPFDVPNIDESPLVGAEIFEFKGGRVTGTTGNEILNLNMSRLQGKRLTQGVPYILRWAKTTPVDTIKVLRFDNVENWDTDETAATDPGNATVKFHGVYPKAHITGYESAAEAHYNFFIGANNTLYWPGDEHYSTSNMKGFRGYFYITPGDGPSPVSRYRNMPAVWSIEEETPTDLTNEGVKELKNERTKLFQDGQIVLNIDGVKYDIQGRIISDL